MGVSQIKVSVIHDEIKRFETSLNHMKLYKSENKVILEENNQLVWLETNSDWDGLINRDDLYDFLHESFKKCSTDRLNFNDFKICKPIGSQEVWAAGVTYHSSRLARMEESKDAGGGDFYSRVYGADRPELFFKATPSRTVGPDEDFRIRQDSTWNVPEPELTLFASSSGKILGYTIGNDVSSRSIEGENPLYLPQAKTFDGCACLGPCLYVPKNPLSIETEISMIITRGEKKVFSGHTSLAQMKRTPIELMGYLFRECSFPNGVFLMTGTGIVPENDFSLTNGDIVEIEIDSIGTLRNRVGA